MTSSSFVSPLDCLTSFLGISLSRAVSSFGRITNVSKSAITAETYIRSWRKPPEIPEVCRMARIGHLKSESLTLQEVAALSRSKRNSRWKCKSRSRSVKVEVKVEFSDGYSMVFSIGTTSVDQPRLRHRREPSVMETRVTHRELQISPIELMISTIHLVISPILGIVDITN